MKEHPYRAELGEEERPLVAQTELRLEGSAVERKSATVRLLVGAGIAVTIGAFALLLMRLEAAASVLFVVALVYVGWRWMRLRKETEVVLRIEDDALVIQRFRAPSIKVALIALDDVEIESKEVQKVGHDSNPIYGLSFNRHVAPAVDVARVAIMRDGDLPLRLGDEWASHGETSEDFRKVRLFLRSRGWVPISERDAPKPRKKKRRSA